VGYPAARSDRREIELNFHRKRDGRGLIRRAVAGPRRAWRARSRRPWAGDLVAIRPRATSSRCQRPGVPLGSTYRASPCRASPQRRADGAGMWSYRGDVGPRPTPIEGSSLHSPLLLTLNSILVHRHVPGPFQPSPDVVPKRAGELPRVFTSETWAHKSRAGSRGTQRNPQGGGKRKTCSRSR